MQTYFVDNKGNELILFFLGWGMDYRPVQHLKSKRDVLYLYDYTNLDYNFDFSKYKNIYLITFSAGVSVAPFLKLPKLKYSVAINGTFVINDKSFGLSDETLKVFENINLKNYIEFRRKYLVATEEELATFNQNGPYRSLESSMQELKALKNYLFKKDSFQYDKVYISKDDKIFNVKKQKEYWKEKAVIIDGGHFAFYRFNSLDEIINI